MISSEQSWMKSRPAINVWQISMWTIFGAHVMFPPILTCLSLTYFPTQMMISGLLADILCG